MTIPNLIKSVPAEEKTPLVLQLLEVIQEQYEEIQHLKDEIAILKGEKAKPSIPPSSLEPGNVKKLHPDKKRPGAAKRKKTQELDIHDDKIIKPETVPEGSVFKDYQDFVVQDLIIKPHNTRYRMERWLGPDGNYYVGKHPDELKNGHFGHDLICFIQYQYHHACVTQPLILEQLHEFGVEISSGQIHRILVENKEQYHLEKNDILKTGLEISSHLHVDDTGARHKGKNGYCTQVGNDYFACFESTESKSRINFLQILRAGNKDYILSHDALAYMLSQKLPQQAMTQLSDLADQIYENDEAWFEQLEQLGIIRPRHIQIATEGALIGSIIEHGFNPNMIIISDDAGQFNVFIHALCWIHAERLIKKLIGFDDEQKDALKIKRDEIWSFYADLKKYKENPEKSEKKRLTDLFDDIFEEKTCYITLNLALKRLHRNKDELLLVLDHPEIPLHNNPSENDIREYVKRRKISGSTRSSPGRKSRDTFISLKKTCRKLGVSFWDYLKDRINNSTSTVDYLPDLMRRAVASDQQEKKLSELPDELALAA